MEREANSNDVKFSCEEVRDLLHCLIENELEDDEAKLVLEHLAICRGCREALSQHIKLHGLLVSNMPWLSKVHFNPMRNLLH